MEPIGTAVPFPRFSGPVKIVSDHINSDGIAVILAGAGPSGGPHVKAFSLSDLDLLFEFYSAAPANTGSVFVS